MKPPLGGKLPYREGTWFAMPLRQGGYVVGRVARHSGDGCVLGYFFGPKRDTIPRLDELGELAPHSAIRVMRFGDLGLLNGRWTVIGENPGWEKEEWPMPIFTRKDSVTKTAIIIIYDDNNPLVELSNRQIPFETSGIEGDSLSGAGAAETKLSMIID